MPIVRSFGWHPSLPDQRDLMYSPPAYLAKAMPASIDLDQPSPGTPFDPAWNQATEGSCGPNSLAENLVFDQLGQGQAVAMPSRQFIYWITRLLMGTTQSDSGVDNRTMLKALAASGFCDEDGPDGFPYIPANLAAGDTGNLLTQPPQACFDQAAKRAGGIAYQSVAQDLNTMKACLVETRRPIVVGFTVFSSIQSQQTDTTGIISLPGRLDRTVGGHDVLLMGYSDEAIGSDWPAGHWKIKNHWTAQWGRAGYGFMPYEYLENPQLSGDFWTVMNVGQLTPPAPTPGPTPTPAGPGILQQVIDGLFTVVIAAEPNAVVKELITFVQSYVDQYLSSHTTQLLTQTRAGLPVRAIVDGIFAALRLAAAGNPLLAFALGIVQTLVDNYLAAHNMLPA